jgi:SAM-dependent methyltransferase
MSRGSNIDSKGSFLLGSIIGEFHNASAPKINIKVLDFGCGGGELVSQLSSMGYSTYGCDVYEAWHKSDNNNSNQKNLKTISSNPYSIPFPDSFFDYVVSSSVMEHVHNKEEAFYEIKRVLKTGGRAIHIFPSKYYLPSEPHMQVPLLNYFLPDIPRFWLFLWATLKVRKKYGSDTQPKSMVAAQVVEENVEYCKKHLCYWKNSEYEKISKLIFGNYSWPMSFYINYAKSSKIAQICNKLPFKKLSGFFICQFRMSLLILKKTN